ncbi:MAG: MarC family protein, partial [Kiritimatiellia bacterium]|nr:MarC family protein [Kiritimatiellia bacterium]
LILALLINFGIMRVSKQLGAILSRFNVLGALIRITGLIVMTIGVQMVLTGIRDWRLGWSP